MLRLLICVFTLFISSAAYAAAPIVVEFFGQNSCQSDTDIQEQFVSLLDTHENLIIVNCRQWFDADESRDETLAFSHKFCNERARAYRDRLRERAVIVVNGRWSANTKQIDPAIKLARLDNAVNLDIRLDEEELVIGLPDLERDVNGKVYVFAYAPTRGDFAYRVDPDLELTNELRRRMQEGESVPFVTKVERSQYIFRPVLSHAYVGEWNGSDQTISYKLSELIALETNVDARDISYAVVVHENDSLGPVIGSGEIISLAEQAYLLPKSEPLIIERLSPGQEQPPAVNH